MDNAELYIWELSFFKIVSSSVTNKIDLYIVKKWSLLKQSFEEASYCWKREFLGTTSEERSG